MSWKTTKVFDDLIDHTEHNEHVIMKPKLHIGFDQVLKYPYQKGKATYTTKLVRVVGGMVYILNPSTKEQVLVGKALWVGSVLVMAMTVDIE